MRLGAFDYFEKGKEPDEFLHRIDKALEEKGLRRENENLRRQVRERYSLPGSSPNPKRCNRVGSGDTCGAHRCHGADSGGSGTGKEVIAKAIHHASPRADKALRGGQLRRLAGDAPGVGDFRPRQGAFTGATAHKKGLFEEAHGGTFFLDEIGEMPPTLQVKFLGALQEGEVRRVGANQATTVDVRVLAATNRDLAQLMRQGKFREDLFYRLNVIALDLPPLRERREDIPALAEHFLRQFGQKQDCPALVGRGCRQLLRYPWPGNVRELENAMERTAILTRNESSLPTISPLHLAAGTPLGASSRAAAGTT